MEKEGKNYLHGGIQLTVDGDFGRGIASAANTVKIKTEEGFLIARDMRCKIIKRRGIN